MKHTAIIALLSLALLPAAHAALSDTAKAAVKVTKPSATVDASGVKVNKPSVDVTKPTLPEVKKPEIKKPEIKKPEVPELKKPEVEVTKPSATLDEQGLKVVKPGVKLK